MRRSLKPLRRTPLKRRSKYGVAAAGDRTYGGILYDSRLEADYARHLDLLRRTAVPEYRVIDVKPQVQVKLEVNGCLICRYICDFVVTFGDGRTEWHEVKGFETETWKLKEKLFRAIYPDRRLVIIKKVA